MKIDFSKNELKKCANNDAYRNKKMGSIGGKIYKQRLDALAAAETLEDTRYLPGHYHELTGNRKGQWSVALDQPYRMIFKPQYEPIPQNKHGQYKWEEIKDIIIIGIINYHKEK